MRGTKKLIQLLFTTEVAVLWVKTEGGKSCDFENWNPKYSAHEHRDWSVISQSCTRLWKKDPSSTGFAVARWPWCDYWKNGGSWDWCIGNLVVFLNISD